MEFLPLSRRHSSSRNVPSSEERGEMDVFAGYMHGASKDKPHISIAEKWLRQGRKEQTLLYGFIFFTEPEQGTGQVTVYTLLQWQNWQCKWCQTVKPKKAPVRIYYIASPKKESINIYSNPIEVSLDSFLDIFWCINLKPILLTHSLLEILPKNAFWN